MILHLTTAVLHSNLNTPGLRGLVQQVLHVPRDGFSVGQDLLQALRPQHVPGVGGQYSQEDCLSDIWYLNISTI